MDISLEAVTIRNGGFFTRREALECGWLDRDLARALRSGSIRRLRQGAYSPVEIYDSADDVGRHLLVARAALARQRGKVALTSISAATAHGLDVYGQDLATVHLVRLDAGSARHEIGTRHHCIAADLAEEIHLVAGCLSVGVARAVWEVATSSTLESGVVTADSALRAHPDLRSDLRRLAATFDHRPGSRRARMLIGLADGRSDSPGESLSRVLFFRKGIPYPELQHEVRDDEGRLIGIADFYWPDYHHLGEFDGRVKYERLLKPGETAGDAVFREKRREDAMRGLAYGMTRWTWQDLMPAHASTFTGRLAADLERSRQLYGRRAA